MQDAIIGQLLETTGGVIETPVKVQEGVCKKRARPSQSTCNDRVPRKHDEDDRDEAEEDNGEEEVARKVKWPTAIPCNKHSVVSNKSISNQNPWHSHFRRHYCEIKNTQ